MTVFDPGATPPVVELHGVWSGYGEVTVLRDVSVAVRASSVVALIGANGAGKTTLLKTISGLVRPSRGRIELGGQDVTSSRPFQRSALGLCHVPEGRGIFRSLTVRENLLLHSGRGKEDEAAALARATGAFPILGDRLNQQAGTLSGGQQQMLALAGAYIRSPRLILVDEASLGLAPRIVDEIFLFLHTAAAQGAALLVVDQFVARALEIASHAYVLRRGEIVYSGAPQSLRDDVVFAGYLGS